MYSHDGDSAIGSKILPPNLHVLFFSDLCPSCPEISLETESLDCTAGDLKLRLFLQTSHCFKMYFILRYANKVEDFTFKVYFVFNNVN